MEIKQDENSSKYVVRIDNHAELLAIEDGLPQPGYFNLIYLKSTAEAISQIQAIREKMLQLGDEADKAFPEPLKTTKWQLKRIGRNLLKSKRLPLDSEETFGRIAVSTTIENFFSPDEE